jgi:hypothetical protein
MDTAAMPVGEAAAVDVDNGVTDSEATTEENEEEKEEDGGVGSEWCCR